MFFSSSNPYRSQTPVRIVAIYHLKSKIPMTEHFIPLLSPILINRSSQLNQGNCTSLLDQIKFGQTSWCIITPYAMLKQKFWQYLTRNFLKFQTNIELNFTKLRFLVCTTSTIIYWSKSSFYSSVRDFVLVWINWGSSQETALLRISGLFKLWCHSPPSS